MDEVEDINHIVICPALRPEYCHLLTTMDHKLKYWKVPMAQKSVESIEEKTHRSWHIMLDLSLVGGPESISMSVLDRMLRSFLEIQKNLAGISLRLLTKHIQSIISKPNNCASMWNCKLPCRIIIPHHLVSVLAQRLNLQVEGNTTLLHRSPLFTDWSTEKEDSFFGARGPLFF